MKRILEKAIPTAVMFSFILGAQPMQSAQTQPVVQGNTALALDLYGQFKASPGNLFFSPYSISTALAMTYAGARGNTEKQMAQVLHFDGEQGEISSALGALQRQLSEVSKGQGIELNIANALWAQKGHPFLPAFLDTAGSGYQANVNQVDFTTAAESAREEINRWVAKETKDKIPDILPPGSLDGMTRLVLANAIYFRGTWLKQFDKAKTVTQPFQVSADREVQAPLMTHVDEVGYMEEPDFQAVELPYMGGELAMLVILPRKSDGCGSLESKLSPELLSRSLSLMKKQRVEIFLPRFKLESGFNLNDTLARMGMADAFGNKADFSGMDGSRRLCISAVFHKAWGEVNEEGTEAAAATAVGMALTAYRPTPQPPPVFRADHPFIFFIRDTRSGLLLFMGRLAQP